MLVNDKIFREYDIRGIVGKDFDAKFAYALGKAYAELVLSSDQIEGRNRKVAVGCDCRLSAEEITSALIKGITSKGVNVVSCGMGPTPQLYYMVFANNFAAGIQVTASHNPGEYNGFKMMLGTKTLSGDDIQDLKRRVQTQVSTNGAYHEVGSIEEVDAQAAYVKELIQRSKSQMGAKKLKVVVDGGNGVGGPPGAAVLKALGCEVHELYTEPDGNFPNHHPDPTEVENLADLREKVLELGADVGIAWDGDADRIGVVDEKGNPIFGDLLLVIYGRQLLKEVEQPTIIGDVKCSNIMFDDLSAKGAKTVMSKTGHSLIKAKIKELDAELAGEMSGHVFFAHRYYGFDDAVHAAARLVEILSYSEVALSQMLEDLPKVVNTPELRLDCPDELKFQIAEGAKELFPEYESSTIDGIRINFPDGWGLVRASNTQPALVMRFEAQSEEALNQYRELVEGRIKELKNKLA